DARIVTPDVDDVANRHAAREIEFRGCDRPPHTIWSASAKRTSFDNGERAAIPVVCERSDRLIAKLSVGSLASDDEQSLAPCGHKHRGNHHHGTLAARR